MPQSGQGLKEALANTELRIGIYNPQITLCLPPAWFQAVTQQAQGSISIPRAFPCHWLSPLCCDQTYQDVLNCSQEGYRSP